VNLKLNLNKYGQEYPLRADRPFYKPKVPLKATLLVCIKCGKYVFFLINGPRYQDKKSEDSEGLKEDYWLPYQPLLVTHLL